MTNPMPDVAREATAWQNAKAQYPETTRDAITRIELGDRAADALAATPRETAEQIAALTAHLTTQTIPASDRAAVLTHLAEIQQHLFDVLVALTLAVAAEHHGSTADEVVAAADEAGCLAGHSRDACETAAQAAQELALTDEEHRRAVADMTPAQWDAHDYLAARQAQQYGVAR